MEAGYAISSRPCQVRSKPRNRTRASHDRLQFERYWSPVSVNSGVDGETLMDNFTDFLRIVGKKPGFYLTGDEHGYCRSISQLRTFIVGIQVGQHLRYDATALDGFTEWVCHRYRVSVGGRDWSGHILEQAGGDEVAAFQLFFEHFEEFLQERERIGTEAIKDRYVALMKEIK